MPAPSLGYIHTQEVLWGWWWVTTKSARTTQWWSARQFKAVKSLPKHAKWIALTLIWVKSCFQCHSPTARVSSVAAPPQVTLTTAVDTVGRCATNPEST